MRRSRAWQGAVAEPVLSARGLDKRYGGLVANDAVDLEVGPGETHALIGPNGAGKTTLIATLAGEAKPDAGTVRFAGRDVTALPADARARLGLARSYQITSVMPSLTALENAALGALAGGPRSWSLFRPAGSDRASQAAGQAALERVGLGARADVPAHRLSHGERRQLEIAIALAAGPRLLLLDEPTAGMGREESDRMIRIIASLKGSLALVLVEHDMDVVFAVADRITVLAGGRVIASGAPDAIRRDPDVRAAYLGDEGAAASA
jgi:branched-chain amino acid transport system ATP-binding protein